MMWQKCLIVLGMLSVCAEGATQRGSSIISKTLEPPVQHQHRRAMKDEEDKTREPTANPTAAPTIAPTMAPVTPAPTRRETPSPTEAPTPATPGVSNPTETPGVPTTIAPTVTFPADSRRLAPFSLKVKGELADESVFRRDLELYLSNNMYIDRLALVRLEPAPRSLRLRRRQLQQATLLEYQGVATFEDGTPPSTEDAQRAQLDALEDTQKLQDFLLSSSAQPLTILQLQVAGREAIELQDPDELNQAIQNDTSSDEKNTGGIVAGVLISLLFVGALIGFFVYREQRKPPPPPPYEFEIMSQPSEFDDIEIVHKTLTVPTVDESESEGANSPRVALQTSHSADGLEVVNMPAGLAGDPAVIDLTRPAKNSQGFDRVQERVAPAGAVPQQQSRSAASNDSVGSMARSRFTNASDPAGSLAQSRATTANGADDADSTIATMKSIASNDDDDSMAGYSLATYGAEPNELLDESVETSMLSSTVSTPPRHPSSMDTLLSQDETPNKKNNPQLKWFEQPRLHTKRSEGFISSDSESNVTLEDVSNPLRNSVTGVEAEQHLFVDDDDSPGVDDGTEASDDMYGPYTEDESAQCESSVMSGILSDGDFEETYNTPEKTKPSPGKRSHGALGYFPPDEEEDFDFDVLPQVTPTSCDNFSDAPSDERNQRVEQDLSGFSKAKQIKKELDRLSTPEQHNSKNYNRTSSPEFHSHLIPSEGSWEDDPDRMDQWAKERRRIKRAARSKRADRVQPPVTMEV